MRSPCISAYLFHEGGNNDPYKLATNDDLGFQGCVVVGVGFTFDDTDSTGLANAVSRRNELLELDVKNQDIIFPYIGGQEVNNTTTFQCERFIINFGDRDLETCSRNWPDVLAIVEDRVKPQRIESAKGGGLDRKKRAEKWWQFSRTAKDLYDAITGLDRVLVRSLTSSHFSTFTFLNADIVFDQTLVVFAFDNWQAFGVLASRIHEAHALFFGATMKDDPRYNLADCFDSFPFPKDFHADEALRSTGEEYYSTRLRLIAVNDEGHDGLTRT